MQNQIYCNNCGNVNGTHFHFCLVCGMPVGENLYKVKEPRVKVPTINGMAFKYDDYVQFIETGNDVAEEGGKLF